MRKILIVTLLLLGVCFGETAPAFSHDKGQPAKAKKQPIFQTPEEVFRAAQRAVAREDWRTFVALASPDLLNSVGKNGIYKCAILNETAEQVDQNLDGNAELLKYVGKINDLSKKHELPSQKLKALEKLADTNGASGEKAEELVRELFRSLNDRPGFVAEYIATEQLWPIYSEHGREEFKKAFAGNTLVRLEINGDKANAYLVFTIFKIEGVSYDDRGYIEFERVNGSWLISRFPDYFPHA